MTKESVIDEEILNLLGDVIELGATYRQLNEALYQYSRNITYAKYPGFDPMIFEAMLLMQKNFIELLFKEIGVLLDSPVSFSNNNSESSEREEMAKKYSALIGKAFGLAVKQLNQS